MVASTISALFLHFPAHEGAPVGSEYRKHRRTSPRDCGSVALTVIAKTGFIDSVDINDVGLVSLCRIYRFDADTGSLCMGDRCVTQDRRYSRRFV
jgi:hypothetical protein